MSEETNGPKVTFHKDEFGKPYAKADFSNVPPIGSNNQQELTAADRKRIENEANEIKYAPHRAGFYVGAEYATKYERADAESRIPGLEARIKRQVERIKELEAEAQDLRFQLNDLENRE